MLVRQLVDEHDPKYGVGSMTWSPYDTAWVSMVAKSVDGKTQWLFPSAFEHLLQNQHNDGGWHTSSYDTDSIFNTLAATLALAKHIAAPFQLRQPAIDDLKHRQIRAIYYLETRLSQWEAPSASSNRSEIIVVKLLQLLAAEGIEFRFSEQETLYELDRISRAKFDSSLFHSTVRSAAAQFLEGFVGDVDFDRVSQHRISGSIMASPAATAAYLMNSSTWDQEAEQYLAHILNMGSERPTGAVPSQYPTTISEITQPLTILLANGFKAEELGLSQLESAADFLESCLAIDSGVIGTAPYMESEADSTAKTISALCQLGRLPSPQSLIVRFETRDYFKTYTGDRATNFRTNCLTLKALLDLIPSNSEQGAQIEKTVRWITDFWWSSNGRLHDNSNLSSNYPTMLMVDALARLIELWAKGFAPIFDDFQWRDKVFICLYQALTRTMQDQNSDGSWGRHERCESTAYGVLILTKLATFSSAPRVKAQAIQAIEKARRYLIDNFKPLAEPDHIWIGKTAFGSSVLFQAYVLAALQAPLVKHTASVESRYQTSLAKIAIQTKYYARKSWFANVPEWEIQACLVESRLFLPRLRDMQFRIFPQSHLQDDRYFETIPFIWLAPSILDRRYVGAELLSEMMIAWLLNRQLDDYIEDYIAEAFAGCIFEVEDVLETLFDEGDCASLLDDYETSVRSYHTQRASMSTSATTTLDGVKSVFRRFVSNFIGHPRVLMADYLDQDQLRSKLLAFMHARINLLSNNPGQPTMVDSSELETQTDRTPHTYAFAYLSCLTGPSRKDQNSPQGSYFLPTAEQQYLTTAMCRHLSTISFMSNSATDQSLNDIQQSTTPIKSGFSASSIDERQSPSVSSASSSASWDSEGDFSPVSAISSHSSAPSSLASTGNLKSPTTALNTPLTKQSLQLTRLLSHERRCLNICLQSLDATEIDQRTANLLGLFVDVNELSEIIFKDPNVGASYKSTTAEEVITQACLESSKPSTPQNAGSQGSVSRARAAMAVEPLHPKRASSSYEPGLWESCSRKSSHENISVKKISPLHQEFNFNKPVAHSRVRRPSQSSIEMSRIERIMSKMGESATNAETLPKLKNRNTVPKPTINPMLNHALPDGGLIQAGSESIYCLPTRGQTPARDNTTRRPTVKLDEEAIKLAKARRETRKSISKEAAQRLEQLRKVKQREGVEEARQRANSLQNKAMAEAAKAAPVDMHPALRNGRSPSEPEITSPVEGEDIHGESKGWIKAPPAESPVKSPSSPLKRFVYLSTPCTQYATAMLNLVKSSLSRLAGAPSQTTQPCSPSTPAAEVSSKMVPSNSDKPPVEASSPEPRVQKSSDKSSISMASENGSEIGKTKKRRKRRPRSAARQGANAASVSPSPEQYPHLVIHRAPEDSECPPIEAVLQSLDDFPARVEANKAWKKFEINFMIADERVQEFGDRLRNHFVQMGFNPKISISEGPDLSTPALCNLIRGMMEHGKVSASEDEAAAAALRGELRYFPCNTPDVPTLKGAGDKPTIFQGVYLNESQFGELMVEFTTGRGVSQDLGSPAKFQKALSEWLHPQLAKIAKKRQGAKHKTYVSKDLQEACQPETHAEVASKSSEAQNANAPPTRTNRAIRRREKHAKQRAKKDTGREQTGANKVANSMSTNKDIQLSSAFPIEVPDLEDPIEFDAHFWVLQKAAESYTMAQVEELKSQLFEEPPHEILPRESEALCRMGLGSSSVDDLLKWLKQNIRRKPGSYNATMAEIMVLKQLKRKILNVQGLGGKISWIEVKYCIESGQPLVLGNFISRPTFIDDPTRYTVEPETIHDEKQGRRQDMTSKAKLSIELGGAAFNTMIVKCMKSMKISRNAQQILATHGKSSESLKDLYDVARPWINAGGFKEGNDEAFLFEEANRLLVQAGRKIYQTVSKMTPDQLKNLPVAANSDPRLSNGSMVILDEKGVLSCKQISDQRLMTEIDQALLDLKVHTKTTKSTAEMGHACRSAKDLRDFMRRHPLSPPYYSDWEMLRILCMSQELLAVSDRVVHKLKRNLGQSFKAVRVRELIAGSKEAMTLFDTALDAGLTAKAQTLIKELRGDCSNVAECLTFLEVREGKRPCTKKEAERDISLRAELAAIVRNSVDELDELDEEPQQDKASREEWHKTLVDQFDWNMMKEEEGSMPFRPKLVPKSRLGKPTQTSDTGQIEASGTATKIMEKLEEGKLLIQSLDYKKEETKLLKYQIDELRKQNPSMSWLDAILKVEDKLQEKRMQLERLDQDLDNLESKAAYDGKHKTTLTDASATLMAAKSFISENNPLATETPDETYHGEALDNLMDTAEKEISNFWRENIVLQKASKEHLDQYCERLADLRFFKLSAPFIPELRLDQSYTSHPNPMIARILQVTQHVRPAFKFCASEPVLSSSSLEAQRTLFGGDGGLLNPTGPHEDTTLPALSTDDGSVTEVPKAGEQDNEAYPPLPVSKEVCAKVLAARVDLARRKGWRLQQVNDISWNHVLRPDCGPLFARTQEALDYACSVAIDVNSKVINSMADRRSGAFLEEGMEERKFKNNFAVPYWKENKPDATKVKIDLEEMNYEELHKELQETRKEGMLLKKAIMNTMRKKKQDQGNGGKVAEGST
ncbi:uncharacterized protein KY384_005194 [Bacidia gigantensis]|uniref:uncharacterized protein n=1 Tax=Bacidia gigantensis TaxID=2732470 RepID=UPI001D03DDBE|nr:uncharacterized protein KY384_005194 [Bacidia gigantensis]KAG8529713.1 hypothetical protein KY384_005194 [Bacidia gigantensis]